MSNERLRQILSHRAKQRRRRILLADCTVALMMGLVLASPMWLGPLLRMLGMHIDN